MSAFNPATQTPTAINTIERTLVHAALTCKSVNQIAEVQLIANSQAVRKVFVSTFQADDDNTYAYIQAYVEIDSQYESNGKPLWENALEMNNSTLPTRYLKAS